MQQYSQWYLEFFVTFLSFYLVDWKITDLMIFCFLTRQNLSTRNIEHVTKVFNKIVWTDSRPANILKRTLYRGRFLVNTSDFSEFLQKSRFNQVLNALNSDLWKFKLVFQASLQVGLLLRAVFVKVIQKTSKNSSDWKKTKIGKLSERICCESSVL